MPGLQLQCATLRFLFLLQRRLQPTMPNSPLLGSDGEVCLVLRNGGTPRQDLPLVSVIIRQQLGEPSLAELVLDVDWCNDSSGEFINGDLFRPGSEVEVLAGYADSQPEAAIFAGIVIRHRFRSNGQGLGRLAIVCRGPVIEDDRVRQLAQATPTEIVLTLTYGVDMIDFEADTQDWGTRIAATGENPWLARVRGRMSFQGSDRAKPGALVELAGMSGLLGGPVFLSAVEHEFSNGNWLSHVEFGFDPDPAPPPESVVIKDGNGNSIELDVLGITLKSPRDIVLQAGRGLEAHAAASAELSSSGQTTVKGAIVMIN